MGHREAIERARKCIGKPNASLLLDRETGAQLYVCENIVVVYEYPVVHVYVLESESQALELYDLMRRISVFLGGRFVADKFTSLVIHSLEIYDDRVVEVEEEGTEYTVVTISNI
ncbi:MAG: hypothetical protein QXJ97_05980 [Desulfurococcaceae archaeon]